MDRQIVYPGQIPLETDLLNTNRNTMIAIGKLAGALFGTASNIVNGLSVVPTTPASLSVNVNAGEIYSLQNVDNTAYSSLPADTTDTVVKQGIQLQPVALSCPAPTTAGFSINYLIEATYQDNDTGSVVLPYYNASNPSQAYSGPNNSGTAQATNRQGKVLLQAKAGIAAATGSQTTPAVDTGYVALAVVTVANGQATITAGNISAVVSAQVLTNSLLGMINANAPGRLLNVQVFSTVGTSTYTPTAGTNKVRVKVLGGGGAGGGTNATSSGQVALGAGGSGGSYSEGIYTSGFSGVTVTIGAGGTGVSAGTGGNGGNSSFGALITAVGGPGGNSGGPTGFGATALPRIPIAGSGGNIVNSFTPICQTSVAGIISANSFGSSCLGGFNPTYGVSTAASNASGFGAGGSGAWSPGSTAALAGLNGASGLVIVEEYA